MDPRLPIRSIDYTVIYVRQMPAMRDFYGSTLGFPLHRELSRGGSSTVSARTSWRCAIRAPGA
jgi:catechol 2,3-dioxygenase-like lactoylglutathione lyase family enzyme